MPLALLATLAALAAGPALARVLARRPGGFAFLDGFVVVSVAGLVLLGTLPEALARADLRGPAFLLLGALAPTLAERALRVGAAGAHATVLGLALVGVLLHQALDGAALARIAVAGDPLMLGILLHQVPLGLFVAWVLRGRAPGVLGAVLGAMLAATVGGYLLAPALLRDWSSASLAAFEAFVGGALLHVVLHPAPVGGTSTSRVDGYLAGSGALAGLVLLTLLGMAGRLPPAPGPLAGVGERFVHLLLETAPALLLAYLAAGLVHVLLPHSSVAWMSRGGRLSQALRGTAVALPVPVCSCGVVPLYGSLIRQGAAPAAALAFLVATPELGPDAVLLSFKLLGPEFTVVRLVAAVAVAIGVALVTATQIPRRRALGLLGDAAAPRAGTARWRAVVQSGLGEMVDHTAPWLLLGLVIAAVVEPWFSGGALLRLPAWLQVPLFALVGLPMYVCAAAGTPLVAVMVAGGLSPGAAVAFLLTGPATNVSTLGVLSRLHGRRAALLFGGTMFALALAAGALTNLLLPAGATGPVLAGPEDAPGPLAAMSAVALGVLFAASLLRRGMRAFLAELWAAHGSPSPGTHAH